MESVFGTAGNFFIFFWHLDSLYPDSTFGKFMIWNWFGDITFPSMLRCCEDSPSVTAMLDLTGVNTAQISPIGAVSETRCARLRCFCSC